MYAFGEEPVGYGTAGRPEEPQPAAALRFPHGYVEGTAPAMVALYERMRPLMVCDLPVLITGETGVGKELIAQTLHLSSPRRDKPFVAVNCAAIPTELMEAELFGIGHRVASGVAGREGIFRSAEGGTLFLDEIGEMPRALQAKLLRALEGKQLCPLGSKPVPYDARFVSATNADLCALMDQRGFRRDLYFRLAGWVLSVPPLRDRKEDIPALVEEFLRRFCAECGKPVRGPTLTALCALQECDWPGNVRELEHEVQRLAHLCPPGQAIESWMLARGASTVAYSVRRPCTGSLAGASRSRPGGAAHPVSQWPDLSLEKLEREAVRESLRRTRGNQVRAAALLGISRYGLRRRIDRYGLRE